MDQTDPWQVVPTQVFIPYDCLLISIAFVVLCHAGRLRVTCVIQRSIKVKTLNTLYIINVYSVSQFMTYQEDLTLDVSWACCYFYIRGTNYSCNLLLASLVNENLPKGIYT